MKTVRNAIIIVTIACASCMVAWAEDGTPATAPPPVATPSQPAGYQNENPEAIFEALPRFGARLFEDQQATAPGEPGRPTNVPVPPNYVIGPGDALSLRVWAMNWEQVTTNPSVSPEGFLDLEQVGRVVAAGQTLEQLQQNLTKGYSKFYTEPTVTLDVTRQRVVEIYVTGDARRPGRYLLPGMATVFTALYAAGGPSDVGSYRNFRLTRAGQEPLAIDLYDYLLKGNREHDVSLLSGDTLFITPVGGEVGVAGEVQRPGRYELAGPVTLGEALQMSGGVKPSAYTLLVQLWRVNEVRKWQLTTLDCSADAGLKFPLKGGDLVVVPPVVTVGFNTVEVVGAVKRPGHYPVTADTTLSDVIKAAEGLAWNAHMGTGVIRRPDAQRHYEEIIFNVPEAVSDAQTGAALITLQPRDVVEIFKQEDVEPAPAVEVRGAVVKPGKYPWASNMKADQLVLRAGGLLAEAYTTRVDLLRLTPAMTYRVIPLTLDPATAGTQTAAGETVADASTVALERGDILQVKLQREVGSAPQASLGGFVLNPGTYPRREGMKVSDLIFAAGGLRPGVGDTIELTHGRFEGEAQPQRLKLVVGSDLEQYRVEPDLTLLDDDSVGITGRGQFRTEPEMVQLQGHVRRPGSYVIRRAEGTGPYTIKDLIQEGGGLLADANLDGIVVYRRHQPAVADVQAEDLNRVLQSVNQESQNPMQVAGSQEGAAPVGAAAKSLDTATQTAAMSATISRNMDMVLVGPNSISVVIPPRAVRQEDWVAAVPVDGRALFSTDPKAQTAALELEAGDTVMVPRRINTVTILGSIPRSGSLPFSEGKTCRDYVSASGGFREDAAVTRLVVVHANGSVEPITVGTKMRAGDVIVVPSKHVVRTVRTSSEWQQWFKTIVSLATATLVL